MIDAFITATDSALRTLFASHHTTTPLPKPPLSDSDTTMTEAERRLSGSLMRVNHVGEVCAQALYSAQALAARLGNAADRESLALQLEAAGQEETNHLAWTESRLKALGSRPSLLNPVWYVGAFGLGFIAGRLGKSVSLGFVVETERQVEAHLESHLSRLPKSDLASRAIVAQMAADEARHARDAQQSGTKPLPMPVRRAMRAAAKVMTTVAHRV